MPIYDYQCSSCGHKAEVMRKISAANIEVCPECGAETFSKQLSAPSFQLSGSGWYATDFKNGTNNYSWGELSWVLGGRDWGRAKHEPFESGVVGAGSTRIRMSAKFYLVAMFFVIFDLEAVFLYAWAVSVREVGWAGFIEAFIFIAILAASLVYLWRIGALEWAPESRKKLMDKQKKEGGQ